MLMSNIQVPVSIPNKRFKIMAIPVIPPGAREFGSKNMLTDTA